MHQILHQRLSLRTPGFIFLVVCTMMTFQRGIAQHCTPSFHFTVEEFTATFDDQSTADGDITSWAWDFGDGQTSEEQNPIHTYGAAGNYHVCLTIVAHNPGCTATFCHEVVIHGPAEGVCHAAFSSHQPDQDFQIIDFTDESTSEGTIGSWVWDFGDGTTSSEQNPTHTYDEPGTYDVCLTITDDDEGCTDHVCHQVVVHHPSAGICHASFSAHQSDPAIQIIDFTDLSTSEGSIGSWTWDFGDGTSSSEQNPSHSYDQPGTYLVCLFITDDDEGCTSHVCHEVIVHHPPAGICHAAFAAHQTNPDLFIIDFTDQSTSEGTIGTWSWDFGDGTSSTDQNPVHTYLQPGSYLVCLTITDDDGECTSHVCHHVVVHHPPAGICHALFAANQPSQNDLTINFTDLSTSEGNIGTWTWDFGDGQSSNEQNPTHTYAVQGTYIVCLYITDDDGGCTAHYCHHIVLHHPPFDEQNLPLRSAPHHSSFDGEGNPSAYVLPGALVPQHVGNGLRIQNASTSKENEYILNYPNPALAYTNIQFELTRDDIVALEIIDGFGRVVETMTSRESKGIHTKQIRTSQLASGMYLIRMTVNGQDYIKMFSVIN